MNINKNIKLISLSIIFVSIIFYIIFKEYEGYNSNYKLFAIGIFLLNFLPLIYFFFTLESKTFFQFSISL